MNMGQRWQKELTHKTETSKRAIRLSELLADGRMCCPNSVYVCTCTVVTALSIEDTKMIRGGDDDKVTKAMITTRQHGAQQ